MRENIESAWRNCHERRIRQIRVRTSNEVCLVSNFCLFISIKQHRADPVRAICGDIQIICLHIQNLPSRVQIQIQPLHMELHRLNGLDLDATMNYSALDSLGSAGTPKHLQGTGQSTTFSLPPATSARCLKQQPRLQWMMTASCKSCSVSGTP